jgi:hypothetical protein
MTMAQRRSAALIGLTAIIAAGLATLSWVALPTQQGFVVLAVLIVVGAIAVWKRPPRKDAAGGLIRPTAVVNGALVAAIIAIPIGIVAVGLAGGRSAAPLVAGIGVAEFGLGAFVLYSLAWAMTKRATLAAILAFGLAGIAAVWLSVPAFLDQLAGRNPF